MKALRHLLGILLYCLMVLPSDGMVLDLKPSEEFPAANRYRLVPYSHDKSAATFDGAEIPGARIVVSMRRVAVTNLMNRGAAELEFTGGKLVSLSRAAGTSEMRKEDAREFALPAEQWGKQEGTLRLWRKRSGTDRGAWNYWKGSNRLRLWYPNPNGAGTLLAEVSLAFVMLLLVWRRRKIMAGLTVLGAAFALYALWATGSRGSLVAFMSGAFVLGTGLLARRCTLRNVAFFLIILFGVALALYFGFLGSRFGQQLFKLDAGNLERLYAWRAAPGMLASAWGGWGDWCGVGYCDWFQPMDDFHPLVYLIGTHLTWMVAHGVVFSFFYIWIWLSVFGLLLQYSRWSLWSLYGLSMVTLFFVANGFSTLGQYVSLWVVPILMLLPFIREIIHGGRSSLRGILIALVGSALLSCVCLVGVLAKGESDLSALELPVHREGPVTVVGKGEPAVWLVADDWALTHFTFGSLGRDVRAWFSAHPESGALAIAESLDQLPPSVDRLVLVGKSAIGFRKRLKDKELRKGLTSFRHLIFISPPVPVGLLSSSFYKRVHGEVWLGSLAAEGVPLEGGNTSWLHLVPGAELYLPNWMPIAFGKELP